MSFFFFFENSYYIIMDEKKKKFHCGLACQKAELSFRDVTSLCQSHCLSFYETFYFVG